MIHNFSAGPCILPQDVFEEASKAVKDFNGLSILEISHRSDDFVNVIEEARDLVKELLNVPENYSVLFLQGGASLGFLISALNMMRENKTGAYINTGTWSTKAIKEVEFTGGKELVVASSEDQNFNYIPKKIEIPNNVDYLHFTSNNTIYGTQFKNYDFNTNTPLVCDMSSDIFSKQIDVSKFDLIYAGAQKNIGPAGTTLYIVKNDILNKSSLVVPSMLDLAKHVKGDSMFNTPPVFSIYVSMLNLRWLKKNGGLQWIEKLNNEKATILYKEIDDNPNFIGYANNEDRSTMNVTFNLVDKSKEDKFDALCEEHNISGIKGHRSVGGYRASLYNALSLDSIKALIKVMKTL